MNYIKFFESFNSIDEICKKYEITNYTINSDGTIDVEGDVDLKGKDFWRAFGVYRNNEHVYTLDNLPLKFRKVNGTFDCRYNKISSLEGSPIEVTGSFYCSDNRLTSLEFCPKYVNRFLAGNNLLTNLINGPIDTKGDYDVSENKLISLEGCPKNIGGYFGIENNNLYNIDYFPNNINNTIFLNNNPICKIIELFIKNDNGMKATDIMERNQINEKVIYNFLQSLDYNYIRGSNIIKSRFLEACEEFNIEMPESINGYKYI